MSSNLKDTVIVLCTHLYKIYTLNTIAILNNIYGLFVNLQTVFILASSISLEEKRMNF